MLRRKLAVTMRCHEAEKREVKKMLTRMEKRIVSLQLEKDEQKTMFVQQHNTLREIYQNTITKLGFEKEKASMRLHIESERNKILQMEVSKTGKEIREEMEREAATMTCSICCEKMEKEEDGVTCSAHHHFCMQCCRKQKVTIFGCTYCNKKSWIVARGISIEVRFCVYGAMRDVLLRALRQDEMFAGYFMQLYKDNATHNSLSKTPEQHLHGIMLEGLRTMLGSMTQFPSKAANYGMYHINIPFLINGSTDQYAENCLAQKRHVLLGEESLLYNSQIWSERVFVRWVQLHGHACEETCYCHRNEFWKVEFVVEFVGIQISLGAHVPTQPSQHTSDTEFEKGYIEYYQSLEMKKPQTHLFANVNMNDAYLKRVLKKNSDTGKAFLQDSEPFTKIGLGETMGGAIPQCAAAYANLR